MSEEKYISFIKKLANDGNEEHVATEPNRLGILNLLITNFNSGDPLYTARIAEILGIKLNSTAYHIEKLLEIDYVKVGYGFNEKSGKRPRLVNYVIPTQKGIDFVQNLKDAISIIRQPCDSQ